MSEADASNEICWLNRDHMGNAPRLARNWSSSIEFRKYRGRIRGTIECDDIRQTESFPAKPSIWRAIAKFLLYRGGGTPWEANASVGSEVLEPWQLDVIQLCWLRADHGKSQWGELLLSLPDAWLEAAHDEYGTLLPDMELLNRLSSAPLPGRHRFGDTRGIIPLHLDTEDKRA